MPIKTKNNKEKFQLLTQKIREAMLAAVKIGDLDEVQALAFLRIFSQAENYWELRLFIAVFADEFEFLKNLDDSVREIKKSELEGFLEKILPKLVQADPDLVVNISQYAALPEADLVGLFDKYKIPNM